MSELLFMQVLRDVGADESKWRFYRNRIAFESHCLAGHPFCIDVYECGVVELELYQGTSNDGGEDDAFLCLREPYGDQTESMRFAENLRRLLAGEPSLEVERLQKALDQATESMWIETMGVERNVDASTQDAWRYPLEDVIVARAGNGYAIIGRAEDNPELAAELKRRVEEVQG